MSKTLNKRKILWRKRSFVQTDIIVISWWFQAMRWTTTSQTPISTPPVWSLLAPEVVNLWEGTPNTAVEIFPKSPRQGFMLYHCCTHFLFCFGSWKNNRGVCLDSGKCTKRFSKLAKALSRALPVCGLECKLELNTQYGIDIQSSCRTASFCTWIAQRFGFEHNLLTILRGVKMAGQHTHNSYFGMF